MIRVQLYNRTKCVAGYLDDHGNLKNDLDQYWVTTEMMPVEPEAHCIYSGLTYIGNRQYAAFYDKHLNFVSKFVPNIEDTETEIIIPENVYYVRFSICKHTKINLFNVPIEEGSLNEISGSTEAGATFTRTASPITIAKNYGDAQLMPGNEYTISTTKPVYQIGLFYYRMTPTGLIYDSFDETPFNQEINKYTFTTPTDPTMCEMKVRFYTPDQDRSFNIMLNEGPNALEYMPPSDNDLDDRYSFSFVILQEAFKSFRGDLYQWLKTTLSPNLTKGDLDIIIKLMCYIFGDLMGTTYDMKNQVDADLAEEQYLRHLCKVIGYEWEEGLTADQQRESIKMFIDIRRKRGTPWSLQNLISVFGQDKVSFYSTSDLRGVKIIECNGPDSHYGIPDKNGLYPGDITIEVPQFSSILRDAIDNIRLIGTRIIFTYVIYCGIFKMSCNFTADREIWQWFDPAYWGYDPKINEFGPIGEDTIINDIRDWPIVHRVKNAVSNFYCAIYIEKKDPYERGFVWHERGNENYKGFLVDDETLKDEDTMYGYGTKD